MVLDIEKFHHTCPILPAHKKMFLLKGPKGFCIKHNAPFSCSSSSSSVGIIANAGVDIWSAEGVDPTEKYEDDMSNFRYPIPSRKPAPYSYAYDRTEALWRIACLRIPWHPIKFHDYAFIFTFLGFLWNLTDRTITLPEAKRKKFSRVQWFRRILRWQRCLMIDVMKLHGSLCHLAFVYQEGRTYLPLLSNFVASFGDNPYMECYPTSDVMRDLEWWEKALSGPGVIRCLFPLGPRIDRHLYVDASTAWGIGVLFNGQWDAWRCSGEWRSKARHNYCYPLPSDADCQHCLHRRAQRPNRRLRA
jgi:hypothetical protein